MDARAMERIICDGLRSMEWYRYLRAMWIVCRELLDLYSDSVSDLDSPLFEETLDLIRSVAEAETVSADSLLIARCLDTRWEWIIDEHEDMIHPGLWNVWMVYGMLTAEIAGEEPDRYFATERLNLALTMQFRENPSDGGTSRRRLNEEIDRKSPMGAFLCRIQRIVAGVGLLSATVKDPYAARDMLLGGQA